MLEACLGMIPMSMKFHVDNIDAAVEANKAFIGKPLFTDQSFLKLPYPVCWVDGEKKNKFTLKEGQTPVRQRGYLLMDGSLMKPLTEKFGVLFVVQVFNKAPREYVPDVPFQLKTRWTPEAIAYWVRKNTPEGNVSVQPHMKLPEDVQQTMMQEGQSDLTFIEAFLRLLHCKNIGQKKISPPKKLVRSRAKKKKPPLYDYHVLVINPTKSQGTSGGQEGFKGRQRLHLTRGHFKRFTEEKPLFGKYTGTYWWQPHVRGSKQEGIVHKDYELEP
jgi:hypothetical protein